PESDRSHAHRSAVAVGTGPAELALRRLLPVDAREHRPEHLRDVASISAVERAGPGGGKPAGHIRPIDSVALQERLGQGKRARAGAREPPTRRAVHAPADPANRVSGSGRARVRAVPSEWSSRRAPGPVSSRDLPGPRRPASRGKPRPPRKPTPAIAPWKRSLI